MKYLTILGRMVLLLLTTTTFVRAQQPVTPPAATAPAMPSELDCRVLTGRVTDPFAFPLTGATIMLRSPGKGFTPDAFSTNAEGHYIITAKQAIPRNTVMEITALGYATLELPLTSCRPLDLTMMPLVSTSYKAKFRAKKMPGNGKVR